MFFVEVRNNATASTGIVIAANAIQMFPAETVSVRTSGHNTITHVASTAGANALEVGGTGASGVVSVRMIHIGNNGRVTEVISSS